MTVLRIERIPRRRGAFGLDERRWPDPAQVEAGLRTFLAGRLPEIWPLPTPGEPLRPGEAPDDDGGRTLALLLPRGHVAVLRIARDPHRPGPASHALAARCRAMRIPHATVSSVEEGRAALRRMGIEPRPQGPSPRASVPASVFERS